MDKLDFKQEFTIRGIPVYIATEASFRGVFLAKEIMDLFFMHFGNKVSPNPFDNLKDSNNE